MMPTMQEIDELTREWFLGPISDEDFAKLCAAARRGVEVEAIEDRNARFAIEGCIEYGRQGVNPPPDNHWLAPFWQIGKKLSEIAEKDDRLTHLEEAYQSAMRVGSEAQRRAEKLEAELAALKAAQPEEMPSTADDEATRWRHGEPTQPQAIKLSNQLLRNPEQLKSLEESDDCITNEMLEAAVYAQQPNQPSGGSNNTNRLKRRAARIYKAMRIVATRNKQPERVSVPREQLEHWAEYWNGSTNERAMSDALEHILGEVTDLLAAAQEGK